MSKEKTHSLTPKGIGSNLCDAICLSAQLLKHVRTGISLTAALAQVPADHRSAVQSLTFEALRFKPKILQALQAFLHKSPDIEVEDLLVIAVATLFAESGNHYAPHTLVNEVVKAADKNLQTRHAKGMLNAVLRRIIENPAALNISVQDAQYPSWWVKYLKKSYPVNFSEILETNLMPAKMFLRVNPRKTTVAHYLEKLREAEIDTLEIPMEWQQLAPNAVALASSLPVKKLPGFDEGLVSVQDLGAQIAAHLVAPSTAQRILDACAAPGGKASQMLELADISLDVLEISEERMERVQESLDRLNLHANLIIGDAAKPNAWFRGELYDSILADVPCSATGIIRRHPDILYLRKAEDIGQLQKMQREIVSQLWALLKPGGRLIFVTCSILPQEGEDQYAWFSKNLENAVALPSLGQLLPSKWHDGFYYGVLQKL
jgi:16S rRNA (cytosine967-C5)-methyltransferase